MGAFDGIPIYLRANQAAAEAGKESFTLYCADHVKFSESHRERLAGHGVKFVYIPMAMQTKFREQTEARLNDIAADPTIAVSVKSEIVYETSVELVNELLSEPQLTKNGPRLERVSRAVTTLVLNDPTAFSHLFAASHHDFYTATHMVNVATWMVPLAYALGYHDPEELNHICQAGVMHDIGKVYVSAEILNKKGKLSDQEWATIKKHPELGCKHLERYAGIHPLVHAVTLEHHERIDGTGYPRGIKGDQMHPISRICAVVDSFDAMTAFRPFKERTMSVSEALQVILKETPLKYDETVVKAWMGLLQSAEREGVMSEPLVISKSPDGTNHRQFPRFPVNCPSRAHVLEQAAGAWQERPGIQVVTHNISRSGLAFLSQVPVQPGEHVRVYMQGTGTLNRTIEGITNRCRAYRDGWYETGVQMASLESEETTNAIVAA